MTDGERGVRWFHQPEWLFAVTSTLVGLVLIALIPPLAGGNETLNFQRAASIAVGQVVVAPTALPSGIAESLTITRRRFPEGITPPYSYSRADFDRVAELKLDKEHPVVVQPNPIAVLNPIAYLPQVPVISVGMALGLSPLSIFYLARLFGLAAGIALTFFAIRVMPVHKYLLAAVALLPPMIFSRSTLDADQFNNGLAFLVVATIARRIVMDEPWRRGTFAALAAGTFALAQSKSAYLLVPSLVLAIPPDRLGMRKVPAWALVILPGIIASIAWVLILRSTFATTAYRTWSGVVMPEEQLHLVLADPLGFGGTLLRTVFATSFIPRTLLDFVGRFGPPVSLPLPYFPVLAVLLVSIGMSEGRQPAIPVAAKVIALLIAFATLCIILTLLYLQWTRVGASTVDGFNGRYLYPLVPLLLLILPAGDMRVVSPAVLVALLVLVSNVGMLLTTWATYWG